MNRIDKLFVGAGGLWLALFAFMVAQYGAHQRVSAATTPTVDPGAIASAARDGDLEVVTRLLDAGVDVNAGAADGATALHWAVYREDQALARALLAAGADVAAATREGATPLSLAATNGDAETIATLVDAGADVNATLPNGETALMLAARTGATDAITTLLDAGAEIDATEELRGTTALMWAAANRNVDAVRLLLERGADHALQAGEARLGRGPYLAPSAQSRISAYRRGYVDDDPSITQEQRLSARASFLDQDAAQELARLRTERASDEDGDESAGAIFSQAVEQAEESEEVTRPPSRRGGGLTALVFAVREGDLDSAKALIDAGADVNQTTYYGWTPLLTAVQNRYYQLAAYLLEQGADPNIANEGGWTPLYIATDNRNIEGGDYPTRRPDMDHLALIDLLLEHGADPNLRMASSTETRTIFTNQWLREEGATPFLRAAQSGDVVLMRRLLDRGADPTIATRDGVTPLMVASGIGWVEGVTYEWSREQTLEAIELILDLGADVNAHDDVDGRTALMGAAHKGRNDVIALLVERGADLAARDIGSRDSVHDLYGARWQALDYAEGLVRVGVQSAIAHPETAAYVRALMIERGLEVPPEGRTLESVCIVTVCQPT